MDGQSRQDGIIASFLCVACCHIVRHRERIFSWWLEKTSPHMHLTNNCSIVFALQAGHPTHTPQGRLCLILSHYQEMFWTSKAKDVVLMANSAHLSSAALNFPCQESSVQPSHRCDCLLFHYVAERRFTWGISHRLLVWVAITQQFPWAAALCGGHTNCVTLATFSDQSIGCLWFCNAYLNFHVCHQDCEVG